MKDIFCTKCGSRMNANANFCNKCGAPVQGSNRNQQDLSSIICYECGQNIPATVESCPNCGAPMPHNNNHAKSQTSQSSTIVCYECGLTISINAETCPNCGAPQRKSQYHEVTQTQTLVSKQSIADEIVLNQCDEIAHDAIDAPTHEMNQAEVAEVGQTNSQISPLVIARTNIEKKNQGEEKSSKQIPTKVLLFIFLGLLIVSGIVIGVFYYNNIYLPEKRDAEAARYYVIASMVRMRSTPEFEADYNKVESYPYGTELLIYDTIKDAPTPYFHCKYAPKDAKGKVIRDKSMEGFVAYDYLMSKADFFLLNSIFGNDDARKMLSETRYKKALLTYFKSKHFRGNIDAEKIKECGISSTFMKASRWQVICRHEKAKSNNVYRSKKYRKDSKFSDVAIIIQNIDSGERRMLYFVFDDDETSHLLLEQDVTNTGYMKDRTLQLKQSKDGKYYVSVAFEN